jgi:putative membrane protein
VNILNGEKSIHQDAYTHVDEKRMVLRDYLAIDRTVLSNQNTFLAYVRTALTLFVAGVTFIRFFDNNIVESVGWVFVPVGIATFIIGAIRYNKIRVVLERIGHLRPKHGK